MVSDRTTSSPGSGARAGDPDGSRDARPDEPRSRETRDDDSLAPEEEPVTTGTLFIMLLFLMAMGAMWGLMYLTLLSR